MFDKAGEVKAWILLIISWKRSSFHFAVSSSWTQFLTWHFLLPVAVWVLWRSGVHRLVSQHVPQLLVKRPAGVRRPLHLLRYHQGKSPQRVAAPRHHRCLQLDSMWLAASQSQLQIRCHCQKGSTICHTRLTLAELPVGGKNSISQLISWSYSLVSRKANESN